MSRGIKVLWIVLGGLFALGIILAAIGFSMGGVGGAWVDRQGIHFGDREPTVYEVSDLESEAFENVNIELLEADVEVVTSANYGYEFTYTGNNEPTVEVVNGTLNVVEAPDDWRVYILNFANFWEHQAKLTIYVPSDATLNTVKLAVASGDTYQGGADMHIKNLDCQSAAGGSVNLGALTLEQLSMNVASGDIRLDTVTANEATISMMSGMLDVNQGSFGSLALDVASGDVWYAGTIVDKLELRMVSGDADFELIGNEEDYVYSIDCISGEIRINGREVSGSSLPESLTLGDRASASGNIEIDITSGSVNINF